MIEVESAESGLDSRDGVSGTTDDAISAPTPEESLVLVPRGGSFEGQVAIVGPTRIEGHVRGSVRGAGELRLGSQARVEGRVECEALESEGEIVGPVVVRTRARFGAGARLDGDLRVPVMIFDEEAILNGHAHIGGGAGNEKSPHEVD